MDHIVGNAVQRVSHAGVLPEVRVEASITNPADDGIRVGCHGGLGDVLVPGIIRGEQVRAEQ